MEIQYNFFSQFIAEWKIAKISIDEKSTIFYFSMHIINIFKGNEIILQRFYLISRKTGI